jgi:hypothetical protein
MEGLAKIDAIYVALVFIVPGYVFLSLRNQFVAGQGKIGKEQILSYLTISGVNFALCGWIIYAAYKSEAGVPIKARGSPRVRCSIARVLAELRAARLKLRKRTPDFPPRSREKYGNTTAGPFADHGAAAWTRLARP